MKILRLLGCLCGCLCAQEIDLERQSSPQDMSQNSISLQYNNAFMKNDFFHIAANGVGLAHHLTLLDESNKGIRMSYGLNFTHILLHHHKDSPNDRSLNVGGLVSLIFFMESQKVIILV